MYFTWITNVLINRRNIEEKTKGNKKRVIKHKHFKWEWNTKTYLENKQFHYTEWLFIINK